MMARRKKATTIKTKTTEKEIENIITRKVPILKSVLLDGCLRGMSLTIQTVVAVVDVVVADVDAVDVTAMDVLETLALVMN